MPVAIVRAKLDLENEQNRNQNVINNKIQQSHAISFNDNSKHNKNEDTNDNKNENNDNTGDNGSGEAIIEIKNEFTILFVLPMNTFNMNP